MLRRFIDPDRISKFRFLSKLPFLVVCIVLIMVYIVFNSPAPPSTAAGIPSEKTGQTSSPQKFDSVQSDVSPLPAIEPVIRTLRKAISVVIPDIL